MNNSITSSGRKTICKVCFATIEYPPDMGGVSKSAKRIVHFLTQSGFEVHVFVPTYKKMNKENSLIQETIENIKVYRVNCNTVNSVEKEFLDAIAQIDQKENFEIFHGFFLYMAYPCIEIAQHRNRPVIASFRGIDAIWMNLPSYSVLAKRILTEASWITSVSSESLKCANAIIDIKNRSSFIFNSIVSNNQKKWQLNPINKKIVGTVSTFREKKNLPLLLDAYAQLDKNNRKNLLLVGDFIENKAIDYERKTNFLKLAQQYGVREEIIITGYIHNTRVYEFLLAMNVFVLSSKHEGLPNAIMEAVNIGIPIVSTNVDGIKDILEDGKNALLVPSGDDARMKDAMESIIKDEKLALKLSKGALELNKALNPESEKEKWIDLYKHLLN